MERATVEIYEREAAAWAERRPARYPQRAAALSARSLSGLARIDLGCGHGAYLPHLGHPVIGIDAAGAMVRLARDHYGEALLARADLEALPIRDRSLGGAWARNTYLHLPETRLPLALANLHRSLAPGAPLAMSMLGLGDPPGCRDSASDDFPGRFFARWEPERLVDVVEGAGFEMDEITSTTEVTWVEARRQRTLPDTVAEGMKVLVCGLNPSLVAADAGYGYAGPTNRFWKAAERAGLLRHPRSPLAVLHRDGVGMTDIVKRATPGAAELTAEEYRRGAARVERLVAWLQPRLVLFVGQAGWRAAVDRHAGPGLQPEPFGGAPAYVMPSTSGLNARTRMEDLVAHLRDAGALAGNIPGPSGDGPGLPTSNGGDGT